MSDTDLPSDRLERALFLMNLMIERATGNHADHATYRLLRREFMQDHVTADLLPRYVRTCRDRGVLASGQGLSPKWEGRRIMIREDFAPLLDALEAPPGKPLDAGTAEVLTEFSPDGLAAVWHKALARTRRRQQSRIASR